jgi:hypothetical protein
VERFTPCSTRYDFVSVWIVVSVMTDLMAGSSVVVESSRSKSDFVTP